MKILSGEGVPMANKGFQKNECGKMKSTYLELQKKGKTELKYDFVTTPRNYMFSYLSNGLKSNITWQSLVKY